MKHYVAFGDSGQHFPSGNLVQECDARFDAERMRKLFEPSSLGAVSDDPVFAIWKSLTQLRESRQPEMKSLPMQHSANAKNPERARGAFRDILKLPNVIFSERSVGQYFHRLATNGAKPFLGLRSGC